MWGIIKNKFFLFFLAFFLFIYVSLRYIFADYFVDYLSHKGIEWGTSHISFEQGKPSLTLEDLSISKNSSHVKIKKCVLKPSHYKNLISSFFQFYTVNFEFSNMRFQQKDFRIDFNKIQGRLDHLKKNHYSTHSCEFDQVSFYKKIYLGVIEKTYLNFIYDNQKIHYALTVPKNFSSHANLTLVSEGFPLRGKVICKFKEFQLFLKTIESFHPSVTVFKKLSKFLFSEPNQEFSFDLQADGVYFGPFRLYDYEKS